MSVLKGKMIGNSLHQKRISKNHRHEVERVAESEVAPNRHVFVSVFGRETEEKVEK